MMYPFLTPDDKTEIVHSETLVDGSAKVYLEKPDAKDGFHQATCFCRLTNGKMRQAFLKAKWLDTKK